MSIEKKGEVIRKQNSSVLFTEKTTDKHSSSPKKYKSLTGSTSSLTSDSSLITSYNEDEDEKVSAKTPVKFKRKNR